MKPGALKTLSDSKLTVFVTGKQQKSRFQKEKEAKEAKKQKELADAAKIYGDFVASFDGTNERDGGKSFVRGRMTGDVETSNAMLSSRRGSKKPPSQMELLLEEMKNKDAASKARGSGGASNVSSTNGTQKPKRAIDDFLEEIKAKQAGGISNEVNQPSRMIPDLGERGSFDDGDPDTTNLYVGNLAPTTTEETLNDIFSKFGEIYSVKIMWPRTEEERARKRNCGFVSFMLRADADDARNAMDRADIEGHVVSVGWGKAIKKLSANKSMLGQAGGFLKVRDDALPPGLPFELHDKMAAALSAAKRNSSQQVQSTTPEVISAGQQSKITSEKIEKDVESDDSLKIPVNAGNSRSRTAASKGRWDAPPTSVATKEPEMGPSDPRVIVKSPEDINHRALLDRLARYVSKDGAPLESIIAQREAENPDYVCLREPESNDGVYYRWKVFSLLMGDKEHRWRTKPFQMAANGKFWVPPPMTDSDSDSEEEAYRQRERQRQRDREKLRSDRYKFSTGAQLQKARERAAAESRDIGEKHEKNADNGQKKEVDLKSAIGLPLREDDFNELQGLLQELNCSREKVQRCMGFALDHAECSGDIIDVIKESLLVDETSIHVKIGRLYVLSDILHNASAPVRHASTYRTLIQHALPEIFEHLNKIYRYGGLGRMTANSMEEKIMELISVWERWSVYPPLYINGLEATFQRKSSELESDTPLIASKVDAASLSLDELKRQARNNGVHFDHDGSTQGLKSGDDALRLFKKIFYAQKYLREKAKHHYGSTPTSEQSSTTALDTGLNELFAKKDTNPLLSIVRNSKEVPVGSSDEISEYPVDNIDVATSACEYDDDDDDIDGVALDATEFDVDGAPLDDIDGESMDTNTSRADLKRRRVRDTDSKKEKKAQKSKRKRRKKKEEQPVRQSKFSDASEGSSEEDSRS